MHLSFLISKISVFYALSLCFCVTKGAFCEKLQAVEEDLTESRQVKKQATNRLRKQGDCAKFGSPRRQSPINSSLPLPIMNRVSW